MSGAKRSMLSTSGTTPEARTADALERIADSMDTYKKYIVKYLKWYLIGIFILIAIRILILGV